MPAALALFLVGAGITLLTGRGVLFSGMRQLLIGLGAAGLTFEDVERGRYARIYNIQRRLKAGDLDASLRPIRQPETMLEGQAVIA